MDAKEIIQSESQLQFFQFTSKQLKIETRICIKRRVADVLNRLFESLKKKELVDLNCEKAQIILEKTVNNIIDKFEPSFIELEKKFDKYIFVPDNVLMFENFLHTKYDLNAESKQSDIDMLITEFKQLRLFSNHLQQEINTYEMLKDIIDDENYTIEIMRKILDEMKLFPVVRKEEILIRKLDNI